MSFSQYHLFWGGRIFFNGGRNRVENYYVKFPLAKKKEQSQDAWPTLLRHRSLSPRVQWTACLFGFECVRQHRVLNLSVVGNEERCRFHKKQKTCNNHQLQKKIHKPRCYPQQRLGNNASKEHLHARLFPTLGEVS